MNAAKKQKGLLENESFATAPFLRLWFNFLCFFGYYLRIMGGIFELRHSKADREFSRGLSVENFSVFIFCGVKGVNPPKKCPS